MPNEMDCETHFNIKPTERLQVLQSMLEEVQEGHREYATKANRLFSKMKQYETYFGLQLPIFYSLLLNNILPMFKQ